MGVKTGAPLVALAGPERRRVVAPHVARAACQTFFLTGSVWSGRGRKLTRPSPAALSLTEVEDPNAWSRTHGQFSHISAHNGTMLNGTVPSGGIIPTGPGYKRPGHELPLAKGIPLRILAIGASTTRGEKSSDDNGFRLTLRNHLTSIGNPVNFVGSQRVGNMTDNEIEAYPGARLGIMHRKDESVLPATRPNLILANLGSNDCFQNFDIPNFYKRYYHFIQFALEASPRAAIVMGTLLPTTETEKWNASERVTEVNRQIRRLHQIFQKEGKPVVLAEMAGPDGIQPGNLGPDLMHPDDAGYQMMARVMLEAIIEADAKGYIRPAEPVHGIIQDGELEHQDEAYGRWLEAKKLADFKKKQEEEAAVAKMEIEIKTYLADVAGKKAQAAAAARDVEKVEPPKLRRDAEGETAILT